MARHYIELGVLLLCLIGLLLLTPGDSGVLATSAPAPRNANPEWARQRFLYNAPEPLCPYRTVLEQTVEARSPLSLDAALQKARQHADTLCQAQCAAHGTNCTSTRMGLRNERSAEWNAVFQAQLEVQWCDCRQVQ